MVDLKIAANADECLDFFEQQGLLEQFVDFVDPESDRFNAQIVTHLSQVEFLVWALRYQSVGGRMSIMLEMARAGEPQPIEGDLANTWMGCWIKKSTRIRAIIVASKGAWKSPAEAKKDRILRLARTRGSQKPIYESALGRAIYTYANPNSRLYDKRFAVILRQGRPDWIRAGAI